ncbi:aminotransferase [Kurthia zopfii]|uniref:Aminotransferase n=1 Tax=Kurthia zopfii TaxID=1650 RepID=A0A8B4QA74_9BACL|nr:aminotransferase class I/II-fold pyridoxal phosphate-dependent enzyme [Kurthia zopfii]PWI22598.1 LL-diaminopimelate aminotransferase [Kurthia zopfii]TDR39056.1 aspartate/methionine/tyrosine aminotransferase [Kurthia zopfii]GEK31279.1 aminotransferase [Kurthia zopfii]STX09592.1 LL-diaminopimelate aminotransferase [Kurthia zopfii]
MTIERSTLMTKFPKAIFGDLKRAARKKASEGVALVDLSLGSPDLPPAELVRNELSKQAALADSYGYTLGGTDKFNEAVANYYKRRSHVTLDPQTEIIQTMGSQEGLVHLPMALCNKGDVVLTTDPGYVAYEAGINMAQAEAYYMALTPENDFLPDFNAIPEDICKRAKLLILNLPGNPVPAMPSISFFDKAIQFAKKHDIIILHDAAYSEFYFEGDRPISFLEADGAMDLGIEINSLSKSFSLAGARIAYIAGNAELVQIIGELKSNLDYGTFRPIQDAACVALDNAEEITESLREVFSKRHHLLSNGLKEIGWDVVPSSGGMFVYAKYPQQQFNDIDFVYHVIEKTGVVMVPGSIFGQSGKNYVRIALVQPEELIQEALNRLATL